MHKARLILGKILAKPASFLYPTQHSQIHPFFVGRSFSISVVIRTCRLFYYFIVWALLRYRLCAYSFIIIISSSTKSLYCHPKANINWKLLVSSFHIVYSSLIVFEKFWIENLAILTKFGVNSEMGSFSL